jgi:hypothetical protein
VSPPEVVADYDLFSSRVDFAADVRLILSCVPPRFLTGLKVVRLAVTSEFNRNRRRAKVKRSGRPFLISAAAGLYHAAAPVHPASIELFLDTVFTGVPQWALHLPLVRRVLLARPLLHEVGHHIHRTLAPEHAEPERVADRWSARLGRRFFFRRYWYLVPFVLPPLVVARTAQRLGRRRAA